MKTSIDTRTDKLAERQSKYLQFHNEHVYLSVVGVGD